MTWVNPPAMRADTRVAFSDAEGAAQWLAGLPRANVDTMLESFDGALAALKCRLKMPRFRRRFPTSRLTNCPWWLAAQCAVLSI